MNLWHTTRPKIIIKVNTGTYLKLPSDVVTYSVFEPQLSAITTLDDSKGLVMALSVNKANATSPTNKDILLIFYFNLYEFTC